MFRGPIVGPGCATTVPGSIYRLAARTFACSASVLRQRFVRNIGRGLQDLLGGLDPYVGAGGVGPVGDPVADVFLEVSHRQVGAAADLLGGEFGEPALDSPALGGVSRGRLLVRHDF